MKKIYTYLTSLFLMNQLCASAPWGKIISGPTSDYKAIENVFGQKRQWLEIRNQPGKVYQIKLPVLWPNQGTAEISLEFGVKKNVVKPKLFVLVNIGNIVDLRIANEVYLLDKKRKTKTSLGSYIPGEMLTVTLVLNISERSLDMVSLNGKPAKGFKPVPWLTTNPKSFLNIYGPTSSGTTIYISKPQISEVVPSNAQWLKRPVYLPPSNSPGGIYEVPGSFSGKLSGINPDHLKNIKFEAELYFSAEQIKKMPEIIKNDPYAANYFGELKKYVKKLVQDRGLSKKVKDPMRYTYSLGAALSRLALYYLATGDKEVGIVLKGMMLDTANRPIEFWIHSSLRRFNRKYPVGALETATLTKYMSAAFIWSRELYSPTEAALIKEAIRYKGLYPCMRWLEISRKRGWGKSNWLAVISAGALAGSRILKDHEAEKIALQGLTHWLKLIEDDGSYSEPVSYFNYGLSSFIGGALILGPHKSLDIVQDSSLRKSMNYLLYNYSASKPEIPKVKAFQTNFGDGDFSSPPNQTVFMYLAYAFNQGTGIWISKHFPPKGDGYSYRSFLMRIMFDGKRIKPVAPNDLNLPSARSFDNGIGFIRSGWNMENDSILALRGGAGGKTNYTHDRPNRNAIILIAKGDYLLAAPGRTSYRSPLHYRWDKNAASHNTITFHGDNQTARPVANIPTCANTANAAALTCDAAKAYRPVYRPVQALRSILYIKNPGYFVMQDSIISPKSRCPVDINYYFANWNKTSVLKKVSHNICELIRPGVTLTTGVWSSDKLTSTFGTGIMHQGYCYFPGDPNEGKKGSSLMWRLSTATKPANVKFYSFFSVNPLRVKFDRSSETMTVKGQAFTDIISFDKNKISVTRKNFWTLSLDYKGKLTESCKP